MAGETSTAAGVAPVLDVWYEGLRVNRELCVFATEREPERGRTVRAAIFSWSHYADNPRTLARAILSDALSGRCPDPVEELLFAACLSDRFAREVIALLDPVSWELSRTAVLEWVSVACEAEILKRSRRN